MKKDQGPSKNCKNAGQASPVDTNSSSPSAISAHLADHLHGLSEDLRAEISMNRGLTTAQAAVYLGVQPHTLENARVEGKGCPYYKIGRSVRYVFADLSAYRAAHMNRSTSENGGSDV